MFCRTAGSRTGRPDGPPVVVFEQHEGIPSVHRPAPPTRSRQAPNDEAPTSGPTPDTRSVQFLPAILCNLKSAMTRDSARVWWWQPGDRGCLNRSTGPSVFPVVDAQVVTHAGGREISVRFKLQLHAPAGEAAFENISLIWAGDTVRAVPSGARVAILRHPDLQIPPSP